jgi:hypothetical protein
MYATIHSDLEANRKEEYNSIVGLASLYERSGSKLTRTMRKVIAADTEMEEHPLVVKLHNYCLEWRSCQRANEKQITYIQFYDGFFAKYVGCFSCPLTRNAFEILDLDDNSFISWEELVFWAKWCIKEFPGLCTDIESSIRVLFEKYLIPEITTILRLKFQEGGATAGPRYVMFREPHHHARRSKVRDIVERQSGARIVPIESQQRGGEILILPFFRQGELFMI